MTFADEFGSHTATLGQARGLCNPVDKNDEDPTAPDDPAHLVAFTMKRLSPRFTKVTGKLVLNAFGSITVDLTKPDMLMVPSSESFSGTPPLLADPFDHFQCYRTRGGLERRKGVKIDDQFGTFTVDIKRPSKLCVPVDKNGEGIPDPSAYLMCYEVRVTNRFKPAGTVFVNNELGPASFRSFRTNELCLPSVVASSPNVW